MRRSFDVKLLQFYGNSGIAVRRGSFFWMHNLENPRHQAAMMRFTRALCITLTLLVAFSIETNGFMASPCLVLRKPQASRPSLWRMPAIRIDPTKEQHDRFDRTAPNVAQADAPCILTIEGVRYNVTAWAKSHPGGVNVLKKFHGKDATKAFHAAGHSKMAISMLQNFAIEEPTATATPTNDTMLDTTAKSTIRMLETTAPPSFSVQRKRPRWVQKLFTKEDPIGIHKAMGVFVLLHFIYRYGQMFFGDPSAGFGTRMGKGPGIIAPLCLVPHALLSLSSLIFHTVPRERVVGKPMIWQEYRVHNIAFGLRSVITAALAWFAIYKGNTPGVRRFAVVGSCLTALTANIVADEGTRRLRVNNVESTTATMPYWEGCSIETQRKFKSFYAYCQFMATGACIAVGNPAWCLAVLLAIQMASLLMTLVRKGLLSAKGYHIGYTIALIVPYLVGLRSMLYSKTLDFPVFLALGWIIYQLRRQGVSKYALWLPAYAFRIAYGDQLINYQAW